MLRKLAAAGAAIGTLLVATVSQAQEKGEFGDQGQFIFGADRLFSLFAYTQNNLTTQGNPQISTSYTGTSMSLFWGANYIYGGGSTNVGAFGAGNPTFYSPPRLGFDYTIIPHLTLGGEVIAFFTLGGNRSDSANGQTVSNASPSGNTFGLAPRVGYIIGMNDMISFWLRGGLSYYNGNVSMNHPNCQANTQGTDSFNVWDFGLDLDPQVVISPIPHFAFMAGPALDWGFVGNASQSTANQGPGGQCNNGTTTVTDNYTAVNFSITGGLVGWW
jgi:hypothetical protein